MFKAFFDGLGIECNLLRYLGTNETFAPSIRTRRLRHPSLQKGIDNFKMIPQRR